MEANTLAKALGALNDLVSVMRPFTKLATELDTLDEAVKEIGSFESAIAQAEQRAEAAKKAEAEATLARNLAVQRHQAVLKEMHDELEGMKARLGEERRSGQEAAAKELSTLRAQLDMEKEKLTAQREFAQREVQELARRREALQQQLDELNAARAALLKKLGG